jgi:hypothetical protein
MAGSQTWQVGGILKRGEVDVFKGDRDDEIGNDLHLG